MERSDTPTSDFLNEVHSEDNSPTLENTIGAKILKSDEEKLKAIYLIRIKAQTFL